MKYALLMFGLFIIMPVWPDVRLNDPLFKQGALVDYLIIVPGDPAMVVQAQRLAESKWEKGLRTQVVTVDSITADVPGQDTQEKIHNFLRQAYQSWKITWVLLMGDYTSIPVRKVWSFDCYTDPALTMESDIYYACLEDDWDSDGNGIFGDGPWDPPGSVICRFDSTGAYVCDSLVFTPGKMDLGYDVYLGRLPVATGDEARIMVDKILAYTQSPQESETATEALFLGDFTDTRQFSAEDNATLYQPTIFFRHMIKDTMCKNGSFFKNFSFQEVYTDSLTPAGSIIHDSIQRSPALYGSLLSRGSNVTFYFGHGGPLSWETCGFTDPKLYFTGSDTRSLSSATYSNVITISCKTMAYENGTSIAEDFLLNPQGGAVSYIGSTGNDLPDQSIHTFEDMVSILSSGSTFRPAVAFAFAQMANTMTSLNRFLHCFYVHQFWGDPEMEIWTRSTTPADTFAISVDDAGNGTWCLSVEPPLDSVLVCLYKKNQVFIRGYTADGRLYFHALPDSATGITATATKHNYVPSRMIFDATGIAVEKQEPMHAASGHIHVCPNPFNASTRITFPGIELPGAVYIYSLSGCLVQAFINVTSREITWNAQSLPSGLYIVQVRTGKRVLTAKTVLQR